MQQWPFDGKEMAVGYVAIRSLPRADEITSLTADDTASCFAAIREFNFSLVENNWLLHYFILWSAIFQDWNTNIGQDFLRTHVVDEHTDTKLFHHLSILTNGKPIKPIDITCTKPLGGLGLCTTGYAILGRGSKACMAYIYRSYDVPEIFVEILLGAQLPPTADQISEFRRWEEAIESYETRQQNTT
ncbi:hypothetical protein P691DRAFT_780067 [Macrolepiota fuliginosa MF-IS2]|uniref:Uncharacterized protein n=1 Tax=Macrolepiota fuliginosa MF-IS2 TaxID=1400762 RepID=A0A9P5WWV3_9AGAR|nr:hypothetical protein P691DRAFT_780067 [Macrolepiota fuliginosa MF-IS2]